MKLPIVCSEALPRNSETWLDGTSISDPTNLAGSFESRGAEGAQVLIQLTLYDPASIPATSM